MTYDTSAQYKQYLILTAATTTTITTGSITVVPGF